MGACRPVAPETMVQQPQAQQSQSQPVVETVENPVTVLDFRVYVTRDQMLKLKGFLKENGIRFEPVPKQ
ncbi:hypothetical protein [Clostridium sp. OF09-36]|uniref:hypothetical protein n=1 Tax=Clostridium sp. OF09-36 TaxID=2292310 RepID=UPI001FAA0455|nr:hypothetical protein [Clostridium sp. OF09-36]